MRAEEAACIKTSRPLRLCLTTPEQEGARIRNFFFSSQHNFFHLTVSV